MTRTGCCSSLLSFFWDKQLRRGQLLAHIHFEVGFLKKRDNLPSPSKGLNQQKIIVYVVCFVFSRKTRFFWERPLSLPFFLLGFFCSYLDFVLLLVVCCEFCGSRAFRLFFSGDASSKGAIFGWCQKRCFTSPIQCSNSFFFKFALLWRVCQTKGCCM